MLCLDGLEEKCKYLSFKWYFMSGCHLKFIEFMAFFCLE